MSHRKQKPTFYYTSGLKIYIVIISHVVEAVIVDAIIIYVVWMLEFKTNIVEFE